jgi:protein SCO1/2
MKNSRSHKRLYGSIISVFIRLFILFLIGASQGFAQVTEQEHEDLERIGIDEHLGDKIDLSLKFTDDAGNPVTLGDYFHDDKPVILGMVYFTCPMLCNLTLNGENEVFGQLDFMPGEDFEVISVSINPKETPDLALAKKNNYLKELNRHGAENGWHFLTGAQEEIDALAKQVGFRYFWNEDQQQYAHASAIYILSADGTISRYMYGISFPERDMRLALVEAGEGKVGSSLDQLILYCYHYDPEAKGYVAAAGNIMRLGGGITLLVVIIMLSLFFLRERRNRTNQAATATAGNSPEHRKVR